MKKCLQPALIFDRARRCSGIALLAFLSVLAPIGLLGLAPGSAIAAGVGCATPTIDGALQDMIDFANCIPIGDGCGLTTADAEQDVCRIDPKFVGCVPYTICPATGLPDYLPNGADIVLAVAAFDKASGITYLGTRVRAGQVVGDADAGGTCDQDCIFGDETNIPDEQGIGTDEPYSWFIDTDCNGSPDITVTVKNNQVFVNDVLNPGATFSALCNGSDLEVSVPGLNLPAVWQFRGFIGFTLDGVAEDLTAFNRCEAPEPLIDIACSGPTEICAGATENYTVTATNVGTADLADVTATITLPAGLNFTSIVDQDGWDTANEVAGVITATESSLPVGESRTLVFSVTAKEDCIGEVTIATSAQGSFSQTGCVEPVVAADASDCPVTCAPPPDCIITGDTEICEGDETQLCGPDGMATYDWTGPGGFTANTQCITVGVAGIYTLTITSAPGCESECQVELITEECGGACPRTPGFWTQQCLCEQGEGGRVKFSCAEMDQITACIDGHSDFFDWADDRASFCATINPETPMQQRKQAKRQFAALLANVCAGELAIPANNGDLVTLPLSTPITDACDGLADASTVGELIDEVDALLIALEPQSLTDDSVKAAYGRIISCLDRINNGIGIPFDPEACVADGNSISEAFADQGLLSDSQTGVGAGLDADLYKPIPNPFTQSARMAYAVSGSASAQVEISIYNTAGQRVRTLVSASQAPGRYEANWDGKNDRGAAVPAGVYFYRSVIGGESIVSRVVLVK